MVVLPISRTHEILLYSSWEGCIKLTVVILTFKTDGIFLLLKTPRPPVQCWDIHITEQFIRAKRLRLDQHWFSGGRKKEKGGLK